MISRMWDGLRASRVVSCFINWKTWGTFKKRFTSVDNKGRCKLLGIAANGLSEDLRRPLPIFELQWLNMKNNRFNWATSGFTKLYVCCFDCEVFILVFSVKEHLSVFFFTHAKQTERFPEILSPLMLQNQLQLCE